MSRYSQNDEEDVILKFFDGKTDGRFLDIGAFDGVGFSNTRALLGRGWEGTYVEPSPENVVELINNTEPFSDRVCIIQAAVSNHRGLARLYIDSTPDRKWAATINHELVDSGSVRLPSKQYVMVPLIDVEQIPVIGSYDFISIDAEWEDVNILTDLISSGRVGTARMICVECRDEPQRKTISDWMASFRWTVHHNTRENIIFIKS